MTRRVYNIVVDESGKPIEGVEVHVSLNRTTYKDTIEVARYGVLAKTDRRGYWEISLHANDTLDDPNSFYTVDEIKNGKRIATHYIRVPSSETYTEPIHIKQIETTPLPATPPPNAVTGIAADNNQLLRGDVRLVGGSGIQLQQDNVAKTITIINTGGGGSGGGSSPHNLLDGSVHPDTEPTSVQRGMLIVGKLTGSGVRWSGLALGAEGRFLKSNGTDAVWDVIQVSDLPAHTHTKSQITDLETITTTPTVNAVPKADATGKIALGWIPQGSGSNLDADKLDGLDSTAFERIANKGVANGYAPLDASAKVPVSFISDNLRVATIGLTVGDGVNTITTGFKGAIPVPFSGVITEWTIVSTDANPPTSGSIEIDILKSTYANYPTMSSIVGTGTKPNISNSNKGNGTPTGWSTTTINAGDIIGFNVTSVTGLKRITIVLKVLRS